MQIKDETDSSITKNKILLLDFGVDYVENMKKLHAAYFKVFPTEFFRYVRVPGCVWEEMTPGHFDYYNLFAIINSSMLLMTSHALAFDIL